MTDQNLFTPYTLGALALSNRIVLAPLTRNRAGAGSVPSEFAATYYSQRASAGLLISEATQISQQGQGGSTPRRRLRVSGGASQDRRRLVRVQSRHPLRWRRGRLHRLLDAG